MKSLLSVMIIGVFLFIVSAGVSYLVLFTPEGVEEEPVAELLTEEPNEFPQTVEEEDKQEVMPVSLRPETPLTVEAVAELARSIMQKEGALFAAEKQLQKEEKRVDLLFEDLKREREELAAYGQKIDAKIVQAKEAVELLKLEKKSIVDEKEVLNELEKKTGLKSFEVENNEIDRRVKVVKSWFEKLDPEQAANYLKEFADRGDIEFAAKLLDSLEDRQTAKVLASFNDATLVAEIIDAFTKNSGGVRSTGTLRR